MKRDILFKLTAQALETDVLKLLFIKCVRVSSFDRASDKKIMKKKTEKVTMLL